MALLEDLIWSRAIFTRGIGSPWIIICTNKGTQLLTRRRNSSLRPALGPSGEGGRAAPAKEVVQDQGDARGSGQQAAGWARTQEKLD
jgi:hypothetical protein